MNKIHNATTALRAAGIKFATQDRGYKLTVQHKGITVSFWPMTGKFWPHPTKGQRLKPTVELNGVEELINYLTNQNGDKP